MDGRGFASIQSYWGKMWILSELQIWSYITGSGSVDPALNKSDPDPWIRPWTNRIRMTQNYRIRIMFKNFFRICFWTILYDEKIELLRILDPVPQHWIMCSNLRLFVLSILFLRCILKIASVKQKLYICNKCVPFRQAYLEKY